jgi:hypothetical protein
VNASKIQSPVNGILLMLPNALAFQQPNYSRFGWEVNEMKQTSTGYFYKHFRGMEELYLKMDDKNF